MTYQDLLYTDRTSLQYFNMLTTLVLYNQIPIQAIVFDKDSKRQTIIVLKASPSGGITTKQMTTGKDKMNVLKDGLNRDFPELPINYISSENVTEILSSLKE